METVTIQRWTVVGRKTTDDGRLVQGAKGYKRTTEPQEIRTELVIEFVSRLRVKVSWGGEPVVAYAEFSLTTGRCIGNPNWMLEAEQLKPLRKQARLLFPKEEKRGDDESEAPTREVEEAAPSPELEVVGRILAEPDDGDAGATAEPTACGRQHSLFSEQEDAGAPTVRKVAS